MGKFQIFITFVLFNVLANEVRTTDVCHDVEPDCAGYGFDYICKGDLIPWSQIHCRKFCNICSVGTVDTGVSVATCTDIEHDCADYSFDFICKGDMIPWSKLHCAEFCNLCPGAASSPHEANTHPSTHGASTPTTLETTQQPLQHGDVAATCVDAENNCADYSFDFICVGGYIPWANIHCRKYCKLCKIDSSTTQGRSTTPSTILLTTASITTLTTTTLLSTTIPTTTLPTTTITTTSLSTTTLPKTTTPTTTLPTTTIPPTTLPTTILTTTTLPPTTIPTTTLPTTTLPTTAFPTTTIPTTTIPTTDLPTTTLPMTTIPTTIIPTTTLSTTTLTMTTLPTTTLSPDSLCGNKQPVEYCVGYRLECSDPWMFENCRGFCKMCLHTPPCLDDLSNCESFKDFVCSDGSAKLECKATCKLC